MKSFLSLFLIMSLSLSASQEGKWVDPVTSISLIAKNPVAWNNKSVPISGATLVDLQKLSSGDYSAAFGKEPNRIEIILKPAAYQYMLERKKIHAPQIYQGEVMVSPSDGKYRLFLQKGLATAAFRPVVTASGDPAPAAPKLKEVP